VDVLPASGESGQLPGGLGQAGAAAQRAHPAGHGGGELRPDGRVQQAVPDGGRRDGGGGYRQLPGQRLADPPGEDQTLEQ
jgi:hypothetical protein